MNNLLPRCAVKRCHPAVRGWCPKLLRTKSNLGMSEVWNNDINSTGQLRRIFTEMARDVTNRSYGNSPLAEADRG